jgi:hypothetical protein
MEAGSAFDDGALVCERCASFADDFVEFVDRSDVFVDDGLVDERPQGLCRLQFRRIGRQKDQPHAIGHAQARLAMPTSVVENEHDGAVDAGLGFAREGFEQRREKGFRHAIVHIPEGLAARRRDEGGHIKPVEAVMAMRGRPLADGRPNAPRDGFQAEPVFVAGEDFDRPLWMFRGFLCNGVFEVFLNAAASSGEADFGFLGRGTWIDMPQAFNASQPR